MAVVAVALLALAGLVIDGGMALAAKRQAIDVAEQAARAGAGQLSIGALHGGRLGLDRPAAIAAADRYLRRAHMPGFATASGDQVTVRVAFEQSTLILGIIGIDQLHITASASAIDTHGVVSSE